MTNWIYKDCPIDSLPDDCVGFVYEINNNLDGRKYIGKKLAKFAKTTYKTVTLKNGTKKKKKVRSQVDSDWKEYWGSCEELHKDIEKFGRNWFTRRILYICDSKAKCSYLEAKEQFTRGVLESTKYYNGQISIRVHGSHILGKI